MAEPLLRVQEISVHFPLDQRGFRGRHRRVVHAVDRVSFDVYPGETLGLVGESGSGKSTTARAVLRMVDVTSGSIVFDGQDITALRGGDLRAVRRHMQMVFQDPYASLNPRMTIRDIVAEPLVVHRSSLTKKEIAGKVADLLDMVGLPGDAATRHPHAFSGGQRQRVGVARALALGPKLIVADEPVSALDVSIQAQIVNLMKDLQRQLGIAYLFIAHDLSVVRQISDRIAVMYAGELVEMGDRDSIYQDPLHPYTRGLLASIPVPDPARERGKVVPLLEGELPDPVDPPPGCRFASRCPYVQPERCVNEVPLLRSPGHNRHVVACHFAEAIAEGHLQPASPGSIAVPLRDAAVGEAG